MERRVTVATHLKIARQCRATNSCKFNNKHISELQGTPVSLGVISQLSFYVLSFPFLLISDGDKRCSCYTFENDTPMVWSQANGSCKFHNRHLVVMVTEQEWEFINKEIQTRKSGKENEWHIGLYRNERTGKWTWINGKTVTIKKWQKDQPQDGDSYTLMARESSDGVKGSFSSIKGDIKRGWICEKKTGM